MAQVTAAAHATALGECTASTVTKWGSSRWGEWRRCRLAHHLKYHLNVRQAARPDDADDIGSDWELEDNRYFAVGSCCHSVLHYAQLMVMGGAYVDQWPEVLDALETQGAEPGPLLEAERLMNAYWAHYSLDNAGWPQEARIVGVEVPLECALGPKPYTSRADTILELAGEILIADTKTRAASVPGMSPTKPDSYKTDRYRRKKATDPQFLGMSHLVRQQMQLAYQPRLWMNAIIKTKVSGFSRVMIDLTQEAVQRWADTQAATAQDYADATLSNCARPNPAACAPEMGSACWALEYCHGSAEARERYYVIGDAAAAA